MLKEPEPNFILFVSNQSFAEPTVDITATIDGKGVIATNLKVENQHHWEIYSVRLSKGRHDLHVEAKRGEVLLDTSFEVKERHWGLLSYWGGSGKNEGKLHGLTFDLLDKPPAFA